jgi:hypothetical protein
MNIDTDDSYDPFENIYEDEIDFLETDKINNQYLIGLPIKYQNQIILGSYISSDSFFNYPINDILNYLKNYSIMRIKKPKIHIMKLNILNNETYTVILKTFWIKIIQRHWKKTFNIRNLIIKKRMSYNARSHNELRGRYPFGLNIISTINGLLSVYKQGT